MRLLKLVPDNTNIGFVSLRRWAFGLTMLLTAVAVFATVTKQLNLGVDFVGGLLVEAKFDRPVPQDQLRADIDRLGAGDASLQPFGDGKTGSIPVPPPKSNNPAA